MNQPLVSISCTTFNHAPFIRACLDGFLMQNTNFAFEIIIHDDASTDGTREIIEEYASKYPQIIFPLLQTENQYSKGVRGMMARFNFPRCKGKYIALCEGDDKWIDPLKLQKQVDFLESNLEYGLICGGFRLENSYTGLNSIFLSSSQDLDEKNNLGFDIDIKLFWEKWCIQTLTVVFRKELLNLNDLLQYKRIIDVHIFYEVIKQKKGYYLKEILGVQNVTNDGVYSNKSHLEKRKILYIARKEILYFNNSDHVLKSIFFNVTSELFVNKDFVRKDNELRLSVLLLDLIKSVQNVNDFKHLMRCLLKPNSIKKLLKSE